MKLSDQELKSIGFAYAYNAIYTPDGTLLVSYSTYDYKEHIDTESHERYMVDGGLSYARRSVNHVPAKDLSVRLDADIQEIREVFEWGTYGKDGTKQFKRVPLKNMSNAHLENIVKEGYKLSPLMKLELKYREVNGIVIED
jgi:hypothetical protein